MATTPPTTSFSTRAFDWFLFSCLALGIVLNVYVFLLPYNFVADETEYLNEVVSLSRGAPEGWNIRSFVYPLLLAPAALLAERLGFGDPESLTSAIRLLNWIPAWLAVVLVYAIGAHIRNRQTGLLAAIFLLYSWFWMLSAKRLMMDVPSAFWLLVALYCVLLGAERARHVVLAVVAGSLAVFTKFQAAPATMMIGLLLLAAPPARLHRLRNMAIAVATAVGMVALYAAVDVATYSKPFVSIREFVNYNLASGAEFAAKYGTCEDAFYYLREAPRNLYSYIFPVFLLIGVVMSIRARPGARLVVLVAGAQLVALHLICHKQSRYLIQIAPMLAIVAAYGLTGAMEKLAQWAQHFGHDKLGRHGPALAFAPIVLITLISFVPRNEVVELVELRGSCREFLQTLLSTSGARPSDGTIALVVPCDVPGYYVEGWSIVSEDLGFNAYTKAATLRQFRENIPRYRMIVLERDSVREQILRDRWASSFSLLAQSSSGKYVAYVRSPTSGN